MLYIIKKRNNMILKLTSENFTITKVDIYTYGRGQVEIVINDADTEEILNQFDEETLKRAIAGTL